MHLCWLNLLNFFSFQMIDTNPLLLYNGLNHPFPLQNP